MDMFSLNLWNGRGPIGQETVDQILYFQIQEYVSLSLSFNSSSGVMTERKQMTHHDKETKRQWDKTKAYTNVFVLSLHHY